ncbi:hypothetical protein BJG93_33980 (plasmid) [Paraburkholderia sprentiae WSM5005]|uniref:Uncharacterized protein n=1 Tax=Paraburkholderia sprentiae WSM5005 TaxID=754502 RepID=A0A1I9YWF8_9BURK|nr:hypothetical protein BJG93_33980 [Paraburkholderia sprentiae WSM5005]
MKTQIWCAVFNYVLIAIVNNDFQRDASLYTFTDSFGMCVREFGDLARFAARSITPANAAI